MPGWASIFPNPDYITDGVTATLIAISLFILPAGYSGIFGCDVAKGPSRSILNWKQYESKMSWGFQSGLLVLWKVLSGKISFNQFHHLFYLKGMAKMGDSAYDNNFCCPSDRNLFDNSFSSSFAPSIVRISDTVMHSSALHSFTSHTGLFIIIYVTSCDACKCCRLWNW